MVGPYHHRRHQCRMSSLACITLHNYPSIGTIRSRWDGMLKQESHAFLTTIRWERKIRKERTLDRHSCRLKMAASERLSSLETPDPKFPDIWTACSWIREECGGLTLRETESKQSHQECLARAKTRLILSLEEGI